MGKNSLVKKNIISGLLYQALTLSLGIVIPRLVLLNLGSEANGLLNSTNQAIVYLALLEGGMGLSITQSLFGPVAKNNHFEINGIMSASNIFYKNVGIAYFVGLIIVSVIYTFTIQTNLSHLTVFLVVILTGLPQVINFLFQGKYRTLITVSGKSYILTNLNSFVYIGSSLLKIGLLLLGFGIIAIQLMYCLVSLIQMVYIIRFVKKEYPWINIKVPPLKEKIGQRSSVFLHQLSGFIFSNTDMLLLTYFCGLKHVSVYSMYTMFYTMISSLISNFTGSVVFAMGQTFNTDRSRFLKLQNIFETLNMILTFSLYLVLSLCILPFLKLYTSGITDISYIDYLLPHLFVSVFLLQSVRFSSQKVIEYAGEFRKTQWHAVLEVIVNITVSVLGVIWFGIYGVLFGTIAALIIRSVLMIYYASRKILQISQFKIYKKWIINIMLFVVLCFIASLFNIELSSYISIIIYALVSTILSFTCFSLAAWFYDKETSKYMLEYFRRKVKSIRIKK